MSLAYIRKAYGVPAQRGGRIQFVESDQTIKRGRILSGTHLLRVEWDGGGNALLHPTWMVAYLTPQGDGVIWPVASGLVGGRRG